MSKKEKGRMEKLKPSFVFQFDRICSSEFSEFQLQQPNIKDSKRMSMTGKNSSRTSQAVKQGDETEGGSKAMGTSLLQEFQNLKDKFKNEDEGYEKG
jgi:hypothetical protein